MRLLFDVLEGLSVGLGIGLLAYSSIKAAKIRDFVAKNELAPDMFKNPYLVRFRYIDMLAVYERVTGDRKSVWIIYVTLMLGLGLFLGGFLCCFSK